MQTRKNGLGIITSATSKYHKVRRVNGCYRVYATDSFGRTELVASVKEFETAKAIVATAEAGRI